jgi:hypothetical protein
VIGFLGAVVLGLIVQHYVWDRLSGLDEESRERDRLRRERFDQEREACRAKKLEAAIERERQKAQLWRVNHEATAEDLEWTRIILSGSSTKAQVYQAIADREERDRELMRAEGLDLPLYWEYCDRNRSQQ